jgi:uncharacterized membrane protein YdbT with pleckstrin-like domain
MLSENAGNENIKVRPTTSYALIKSSAGIVFAALISIGAVPLHYLMMLLPGLLLFILSGYKYCYIINRAYYITTEQIIYEQGILIKTTQYLELYRVRDYIVTQNLFMRLSNTMQLTLLTYDKGEQIVVMAGIPKSDLAQIIRNRVQECRNNNHLLTIDY